MKSYLVLALAALSVYACHGQVPPTVSQVTITVPTVPTGCTTAAPCTFVYSQATVASATATCPATTGTTYTPLNQSSPSTGTAYTFQPPSGFICIIGQTLQSSLTSVPGNVIGPLTIPAQPTAPSILTVSVQVSQNAVPASPNVQMFTAGLDAQGKAVVIQIPPAAPQLVAKVTR
jgi:hypothetical protein